MGRGFQVAQECGWPSWLCLLAGLLALALSTSALGMALLRVRGNVLLSWLALAVALLPIGVGGAGVALGRARVDQLLALPASDSSQRVRIREERYQAAASCIAVGGTFSAPPLLFAVIALSTAYMCRRKPVVKAVIEA